MERSLEKTNMQQGQKTDGKDRKHEGAGEKRPERPIAADGKSEDASLHQEDSGKTFDGDKQLDQAGKDLAGQDDVEDKDVAEGQTEGEARDEVKAVDDKDRESKAI